MEGVPVIKTVEVNQKFGDFTAVNHLNFEINENESIGIIGPNGAGKTTALNIITGYYLPTEGSVFFQGQDITHLAPQKRVQLGILRTFQIVRVFNNLPVYENVALSIYRKKEGKAFPLNMGWTKLRQKSIEETVADNLALFNLNSLENIPADSLSLGNKKKLELAMAHAADPDVLLLDEPFAGLGDLEIDEVMTILQESISHKTVIIVEHKISKLTNLVDKLAVMHQGAIIASGPCEETLNHPEVRKSYWKI